MKCKKVRKMLPLFIGSELSSGKMSVVREHMKKCSSCRKEYERYVKSREVLTGWLQEVEMDWNESEWHDYVKHAVRPPRRAPTVFAPWPYKNIWAYAFMVVTAFVLTLFLILPIFRGSKSEEEFTLESFNAALESPSYSVGSFEKEPQDIVTMTIVSRETGTKIIWFFDKNFNLEE